MSVTDVTTRVAVMFLPHFDNFYDLQLNRPTAKWNLFVYTITLTFLKLALRKQTKYFHKLLKTSRLLYTIGNNKN